MAWLEPRTLRVAGCGLAMISLAALVSGNSALIAGALLAETAVLGALAVPHRWRRTATLNAQAAEAIPAVTGLALLEHRLASAHPVSGLPTRELVLARMAADGTGVLGAIAFTDFDRMAAFDPALSDHVFAAATRRLRAMVPASRTVAQVDRGQVAIWFAGCAEDDARAELESIGYALGETIEYQGTQVVPELKLRLRGFDVGDGTEPAAFLARMLASFTVPDAAASPRADADYAKLARERHVLEQALRQAVDRRELRLLFQPLVDAGQDCVTGAEALLRWDHPELGPVSPARFIPVAEATGLASEIGLWTLNAALREAHRWAAGGLAGLRVAVNVSGLQLERHDLPQLVQRSLERHYLPPAALELELTESVATADTAHCRRIFEQLRGMGVKLAVDDFGTGYSGFSSLRALAFDKIKIDREFVTDVHRRRDSQAICQSILALGRGLGIRVLAEGVERRDDVVWLRRHGCRHFQGYYFAPPLTADAFTTFLRDRAGLTALLRTGPNLQNLQERLSA